MEAGYNALIELEPLEEKRLLEKKKEIIDIAVKTHARMLPAIARCHNPVTVNRVTQDSRDRQVKIREGLKPDRLKNDFTPVEFRKLKSQITTFFEASNLQYATQKEQHGYLHMCLDTNLTDHIEVNTTATTPVMAYSEEDDKRNCMDIIEEEFVKRYPITARKQDLIQLKQQRGQLLTTFINNLMMLGLEEDRWELKPEDWMANLAIAGVVDEEANKESMKIKNPNMTKIRKAANAYEKEANTAKLH